MTETPDKEPWRDEERLPLSELNKAMAVSDTDGQNDVTGNDSGQETPTADQRPSTTGPTGPN
jgi:hypothetical protein